MLIISVPNTFANILFIGNISNEIQILVKYTDFKLRPFCNKMPIFQKYWFTNFLLEICAKKRLNKFCKYC